MMATSEIEITTDNDSYECAYEYTKSSLSKFLKEELDEFSIMKKEKTSSIFRSIFGQQRERMMKEYICLLKVLFLAANISKHIFTIQVLELEL